MYKVCVCVCVYVCVCAYTLFSFVFSFIRFYTLTPSLYLSVCMRFNNDLFIWLVEIGYMNLHENTSIWLWVDKDNLHFTSEFLKRCDFFYFKVCALYFSTVRNALKMAYSMIANAKAATAIAIPLSPRPNVQLKNGNSKICWHSVSISQAQAYLRFFVVLFFL